MTAALLDTQNTPYQLVLDCIDQDLSRLLEWDEVVEDAARLVARTASGPARAQNRARVLRAAATTTRDASQVTVAILHRLHATLVRSTSRTLTRAAVVAHDVLHGRVAMPDDLTTRLRLPNGWDLQPGALTGCTEDMTNLAANIWWHVDRCRDEFTTDLARLREWTAREPELRAPDRLVGIPGHNGTYQVHRHPRPAPPRLTDTAAGGGYETLTASQLDAVHHALVHGQPPECAARAAVRPDRSPSPREVVESAVRCGIWYQQSLLAGELHPWVATILGVPASTTLEPAEVRRLLKRQVFGGAEQASLLTWDEPRVLRVCTAWFDSDLGGTADPVRVFAALHTPSMGAWYQVLRGDLPDLLGYTPMRQVHYAALLGHVADGGILSDFAACHGRRYRDVVNAWDRLLAYAQAHTETTTTVVEAISQLPTEPTPVMAPAIRDGIQTVLTGMTALGCPDRFEVRSGYEALTKALVAGPGYARDAYGLLRTRVLRLANRLLGNQLPADPALWRPDQVAEFYRRCPDLTVEDPQEARTRALAAIRAELHRLRAAHPFGAPPSAVELLTELHYGLAEALRAGGEPQLPGYWRLRLGPGGADEHVWRTFSDWPDLITVVASAKHLATEARNSA